MGYGEFYSNMSVAEYDSVIESVTRQRNQERQIVRYRKKIGYEAWYANVDFINDCNVQLKILRKLKSAASKLK